MPLKLAGFQRSYSIGIALIDVTGTSDGFATPGRTSHQTSRSRGDRLRAVDIEGNGDALPIGAAGAGSR